MGANGHAVGQLDPAFEHATDIDTDIATANEFAAHIDPRRIEQVHALFQQRLGQIELVAAFQLGQLHLAVDAGHFPFRRRLGRHDRHPIGHRLGHDIGQVILALGIVVLQRRQPFLQVPGGGDNDAAVNFADGPLVGAGVFFFDDAADLAMLAHDAAQAERIGLLDGQDGQLVGAGGGHQALQRGRAGQRHVAVQDQGGGAVIELGHGLHDGVAGAELGFLQGSIDGRMGARV